MHDTDSEHQSIAAPPAPAARGERLNLSFAGAPLQKILRGARLSGLSPRAFCRESIRFGVEIAEMKHRGYKVFIRDERGVEYILPPQI
ncbi:hypothetical protein BJF86_13235 [Serinicoccus sp. CNJ-927]|uniref:hypothetical protein n=1 Tax=Serinicoccus sp. CNJ-927 TaxID=1904970 RepID=UPI000964CC7E|nr:hypothetical protein [Serinicoccus sp. CNJ-927]OLT43918.1 hypothetical protein BJF86_13235 [Serinicoccus sp. CNJ-927]